MRYYKNMVRPEDTQRKKPSQAHFFSLVAAFVATPIFAAVTRPSFGQRTLYFVGVVILFFISVYFMIRFRLWGK
jgi:uncharacterized membrane protein YoaK (UPF0700 family)